MESLLTLTDLPVPVLLDRLVIAVVARTSSDRGSKMRTQHDTAVEMLKSAIIIKSLQPATSPETLEKVLAYFNVRSSASSPSPS